MQNVSSSNNLNTPGYEEKEIASVQKVCVFCEISVISQEREEVKGGKNTERSFSWL